MRIIADFHIHSKYSRATSKNMVPDQILRWANLKGIDVIGTGDCTHGEWVKILQKELVEAAEGLYKLKGEKNSPYFILTGEISSIYKQGKLTRRVHTLFFVPDFKTLIKINQKLGKIGNIRSDGRPILGLSAKELAKIILEANKKCLVVPAHIWTPWFSLLGSKSGFESIEECYEELSPFIKVVETGLSSDPPMNWQVKDLDKVTLISNSDAHSGPNLGREANVFELKNVSYSSLYKALTTKDRAKFKYTVEFFPEEGKYHWDGNRSKGISLSPEETSQLRLKNPSLAKKMTIGVESRVQRLANRPPFVSKNQGGVKNVYLSGKPVPPPAWGIPYLNLVPLAQIIAEAMGVGVGSKTVESQYFKILNQGGTEFKVLVDLNSQELEKIAGKRIAEGIIKVRQGNISIEPGYDGVYGKVRVFDEDKVKQIPNLRQKRLL